jgi:hypothetical protein
MEISNALSSSLMRSSLLVCLRYERMFIPGRCMQHVQTFIRGCSYDRAGMAWGDNDPSLHLSWNPASENQPAAFWQEVPLL